MNTRKKMAFSFSGLILAFILTFILAELLVRVFVFIGVRPGYTVSDLIKGYPTYVWSQFTIPTLVREDKVYDFWGNKIKINQQGYRGNLLSQEKNPDKIRIVFLGGSQVFDLDAPEGMDWPHQIETILQKQGHSVEIMNAGMPGHHSWDSLGRMYSELHLWKPDFVIFCGAWNDIKDFHLLSKKNTLMNYYLSTSRPTTPNHPESRFSIFDRLLGWSWFYSKLRVQYYRFKYKPEGTLAKNSLEDLKNSYSRLGLIQYELHIKLLHKISQEIGASLILVKQPRLVDANNGPEEQAKISYQFAKLDHSTLVRAFEDVDASLRKLARQEKDIYLIEETQKMIGQARYFEDHVHTTEQGSRQLASIIAKYISDVFLTQNE